MQEAVAVCGQYMAAVAEIMDGVAFLADAAQDLACACAPVSADVEHLAQQVTRDSLDELTMLLTVLVTAYSEAKAAVTAAGCRVQTAASVGAIQNST